MVWLDGQLLGAHGSPHTLLFFLRCSNQIGAKFWEVRCWTACGRDGALVLPCATVGQLITADPCLNAGHLRRARRGPHRNGEWLGTLATRLLSSSGACGQPLERETTW